MNKDAVCEMIETWLSENANRSLALLSSRSGIADSTLRRAQSATSKPALETIIGIGVTTGKSELMLKAVEQYYPKCFQLLKDSKIAESQPIDVSPASLFETGVGTSLFLQLFARKKISKEFVKSRYGEMGAQALANLISLGIATEGENDLVQPKENWYTYRSPQEVLKVMRNLNIDFDLSQLGTSSARMAILSEAVSEEQAVQIQAILDEAVLAIKKIADRQTEASEKVIAVSLLMQQVN